MAMRKPVKLSIYILIFLVLCGLGYWFYKKDTKTITEPQIPPTVVETTTAKAADWNVMVPATATLEANQGVMLKSAVVQGGIITGIFFHSGQFVAAGQPLFQINPGADRTIVKAPFSGRVGLKQVDLGDYVTTGSSLVTIQDTDPMKVDFSIPQQYLADIALGQTILFSSDAYSDVAFSGKVYAINSTLNTVTRSIELWASIPNSDHKLLPGIFGKVTLILNRKQAVMVVPKQAVIFTDAGDYVFTVKNGIAHQVYITVAMHKQGEVATSTGLKSGDTVITTNTDKIADGWPVVVKGTPEYQQYEAKQNAQQKKAQTSTP